MALTGQSLATIADWAGVAVVAVAVIGLVLVVVQLRRATSASRAQATIQFQKAFRRSYDARDRLQATFPVHEAVLAQLAPSAKRGDFRTWTKRSDLTEEEVEDARAVIGAMNDVAQYVVDGMALRSALQQYHTIFVRTGILVLPYLDVINAPIEGRAQARYGHRMVDLYNAGISYHRRHLKHRGRELALERRALDGSTDVRLTLLGPDGKGVQEHPGFGREAGMGVGTLYRKWRLRRVVQRVERRLRR